MDTLAFVKSRKSCFPVSLFRFSLVEVKNEISCFTEDVVFIFFKCEGEDRMIFGKVRISFMVYLLFFFSFCHEKRGRETGKRALQFTYKLERQPFLTALGVAGEKCEDFLFTWSSLGEEKWGRGKKKRGRKTRLTDKPLQNTHT